MSHLFAPYGERAYRPDIQGVRAIGAMMIMVYHIWMHKVSGGVDVFFVVSGYLMGGVLLRRLAADGRLRPLQFWGRIIKRISPSAYTILFCTLVAGYFIVPETVRLRAIGEIAASALHVENLRLMRESVNYLSWSEPPSGVQQFWALSIQMQFYLFLPAAFFLGFRLSRWRGSTTPLFLTIAFFCAASFLFSLYFTPRAPSTAYFHPFTRVWEFLAGVLLAIRLPQVTLGPRSRALMGAAGLLALPLIGLLVPKTQHYPGYISLIPVLAACFLILAGHGPQPSAASRLLSHRFLAAIGRISFTVYLWHWPLVAFYLEINGAKPISLLAGLNIIALAIVLAALTTRYIEEPFRARKDAGPWQAYRIGAAFLAPVLAFCLFGRVHLDRMIGETLAVPASPRMILVDRELAPQGDAQAMSKFDFISASSDVPAPYPDGCQVDHAATEPRACVYGDVDGVKTIAIAGSSHAIQWVPALDLVARVNHIRLLVLGKDDCPLGAPDGAHPSCKVWNAKVRDFLIEEKPAAVITTSTKSSATAQDRVPPAFVEAWRALARHGIALIGIRDTPRFMWNVPGCVARNKSDALVCARPRGDTLAPSDPARAYLGEIPQLRLVDMSNALCTAQSCLALYENILMYRDQHHISAAYARALAQRLEEELAGVAPDLFQRRADSTFQVELAKAASSPSGVRSSDFMN